MFWCPPGACVYQALRMRVIISKATARFNLPHWAAADRRQFPLRMRKQKSRVSLVIVNWAQTELTKWLIT